MKHSLLAGPVSIALLATTLTMIGCGGISHIPDTIATEGQGELPAIQGSVFGGHAPLIGAHVYVLTTGSGVLGASSSSLLGVAAGTVNPSPSFPLVANVSDPHVPVGANYVVTDSNGSFYLSNGYKCAANTPVYLYAYGGSPTISGPLQFNPAIVNLATLGLCPSSGTFKSSLLYVYLNEVSTVATAYAFQGFTSPANNDAFHIGYSGVVSASEGLKGIQNATNNTFQLYDIQGGVLNHNANYATYVPGSGPTTGPNKGQGVVPQSVINTLADILATCVDSGNTTSPPSVTACTLLFAVATADGTLTGTKPTDTATAAINIARHPAGVGQPAFASTLWSLLTGVQPFTPALTSAPPDFTVGIQFPSTANSIFTNPESIATDANGNFWFTTQPSGGTTGYLAEASPYGMIVHSVFNAANTDGDVAIDNSGNGWAGTLQGYLTSTTELSATGTANTYGTGFSHAAVGVADNSATSGNMYFVHGPTCPLPPGSCSGASNNPTLTVVSSTGIAGASNLLTASFAAGAFIRHGQMDAAGYIWLTSENGGTITRVGKSTGSVPAGSFFPITSGGLCLTGIINPEQPAVDKNGNAWIPVYGLGGGAGGTGVYVVNAAGTTCTYYDTQYGATDSPYGAAVDGASNIWITNRQGGSGISSGPGSLTGLNFQTGIPLTSTALIAGPNFQPVNQTSGTAAPLLYDPMNVAVDISGDVFVTNYTGSSIVEIIGLTTPVYGPLGLAAAGSSSLLGATP